MTCTVIEFQASATSSNFQEILGSGFASGKVFTLPFKWAPFCYFFFLFVLDCVRAYLELWTLDVTSHTVKYRFMAFFAVF